MHSAQMCTDSVSPHCSAAISNLICFAIWPVSATDNLEQGLETCLLSFSTLLDLLTATFLLDKPDTHTSVDNLEAAANAHTSAFTQFKAVLADAKHESLFDSRISGPRAVRADHMVQCLTRMAQHITGLRGGTSLQAELLDRNRRSTADAERLTDPNGTRVVGEKPRRDLGSAEDDFAAFREAVGEDLRALTVR